METTKGDGHSMKLDVYVNYRGTCEEAFRFYEKHLGGKILSMMAFKELPDSSQIPEGKENGILHARIQIGNTVLMGADISHAEPMRSAYLTLTVDTVEEAERLYAVLSEDAQIFMPMAETFFAPRFAQLRDKFGTSWTLFCERME